MEPLKLSLKLGCDAGCIAVGDSNAYSERGGVFGETAEKSLEKISLKPGWYNVAISIDGERKVSTIYVAWTDAATNTGCLIIGDPCYMFGEEAKQEADADNGDDVWQNFLDSTHYLQSGERNFAFFSTGGDGEFDVEVTIEPGTEPEDY